MIFTENMIYIERSLENDDIVPVAVNDLCRIVRASVPASGLLVFYQLSGEDTLRSGNDVKTEFHDAWKTILRMYGSGRVRKNQDRIEFIRREADANAGMA